MLDIDGDVSVSARDRGIYSTDAGNYRIPPVAVVRPRSVDDIHATIKAAFACGLPITARGAGTSCAGNAIGPGVIIDYSRYFNRIHSIDPDAKTAIIDPGVIQGQLQKAAAPYGLRFGPDPSTSNRCTIGGMIGNNACGPHATAYGRTADNITNLVFVDGLQRQWDTSDVDATAIPGLTDLIDANLGLIRTTFGRFNRQVSGYSLEHLLPENNRDLAKFIVGTEGTLGVVTQAEVRLVPVPDAPVLVALGFPDMPSAADAVPGILRHKPLAVEGMDARLVDVVRHHKGPGAVPELPRGEGWLMCEVGGEGMDEGEALDAARAMAADTGLSDDAIMIYPPGADAAALWRIRADGAGLGGRTPIKADGSGNEQAWPGWEDAAVPPENLGSYLRDFQQLMTDFDIDGLVYGHFGDGCVHVRLDMPLGSQAGVGKSKDFLEHAADLVGHYQGSISGEHGDGRSRSELLTHMYPKQAVDMFAQVKTLFDPKNRMNPGVITRPWGHDDFTRPPAGQTAPDPLEKNLRRPGAAPMPATRHGFAFEHDHGDFTTAVHRCTGVGKCRADNSAAGGFMCPSFQASHEDKDSTRGRARILQEAANGTLIHGLDSPEVRDVLDLCLACKACSTDCPTGIDMATYRSEVYNRIYRGKLRPRTHYLLGWLPQTLRMAEKIPGLAALTNWVMSIAPLRKLAFRISGIDTRRTMPTLATEPLEKWAKEHGVHEDAMTVDDLHNLANNYVIVWADSFSQCLDGSGAKAAVNLLQKLGYNVIVPDDDVCCGLTWITTGQLDTAKKKLHHTVRRLAPFAMAGIPIVGVEPSCTAVLRDDVRSLLAGDPRMHTVTSAVKTLAEFLEEEKVFEGDARATLDLSGVTVVAQPHCHHYSVMGWDADRALLEKAGADVVELSGCCGLAGNFGMEKGHYEMSVAVAGNSLLPALDEHPDAIYVADGFSCRTQAEQLRDRNGMHLAQLLDAYVR